MGRKILILLEHLRVEHTVQHRDGTMTVDFLASKSGGLLKKKLKSIGVDPKEVDIQYVHPKVPDPKKVDNKTGKPVSYKDVPLKDIKSRFPEMDRYIAENAFDIVIPTGRMGCKYLLDSVSITKLRGVPEHKTIEFEDKDPYSFWVFPMFSMEYIDFKRNAEIMYDGDLQTLQTYMAQGDAAFQPSEVVYEYFDTIEQVRDYFAFINREKPVTSWDLETNTLRPDLSGAKVLVFSIAHAENQGVTIPLQHKEHTWKPEELQEIKELIKSYVANPELVKVLQNGQFDIKFLATVYGFTEFQKNVDTKIGYFLTISQEESKSFRLTDLAYELTDMGGYDKPLDEWKENYIRQYKEKHKKKPVNEVDGSDFNYEWFPLKEVLSPYASGDVDATLRVHNVIDKKIQESPKWVNLYYDFYPRLEVALAMTEANGFTVDKDYIMSLEKAYEKESDRLLALIRKNAYVQQLEEENRELYELGLQEWTKPKAERNPNLAKLRDKYKKKLEFNPNSAQEKGRLLFDILEARPPIGKETLKDSALNKMESEVTWEDYKTDQNMLEWINQNVPESLGLTDLLLAYSKVNKLLSTYVLGLQKVMNPGTNNVHGKLNITGTDTGRLSSSGPNLQNIPSSHQEVTKFDYRYPIKRVFTSRFEGGAILQADYSALEVRILGLRAMDPGITEAFLDGKDLHKDTASILYNKPEDQITKDERSSSKAVTFGIIYGEQPFSLAPKQGITVEEAEELFEKFFRSKPRIKEFIDEVHHFLEDNGYVETMQGHRRILRDVWGNKQVKSSALRKSVNTVIQGTGAYLTNFAVTLIHEYLQVAGKQSKLVATVHDSIVIDMHPDEIVEVCEVTQYIMENLPIDFLYFDWNGQRMRYPVTADVEIGTSYHDLVDYDKEDFLSFNSAQGYVKYYRDKALVRDNRDSGLITDEQHDEAVGLIESQKSFYKEM